MPTTTSSLEARHRQYQKKQVLERTALSARAVHATLLLEGREELQRSLSALWWSGLAAGLTISLSMVAEGVLRQHLPDTPWRPLVTKLGYPVGFLAVVLGRQQLYTETTLTAALPALHDRTVGIMVRLIRLWLIVLIANITGAWLFAWAAAHEVSFSPELREAFRQIGVEAIRHDPATAMVRGIFGGWVIALMVWLLPSAHVAKVPVIVILTYVLATAGLAHIITGSVETLFLVAAGHLSLGTYLWHFALPVLAGNTIGGVVFVTLLNHAQVGADSRGVIE